MTKQHILSSAYTTVATALTFFSSQAAAQSLPVEATAFTIPGNMITNVTDTHYMASTTREGDSIYQMLVNLLKEGACGALNLTTNFSGNYTTLITEIGDPLPAIFRENTDPSNPVAEQCLADVHLSALRNANVSLSDSTYTITASVLLFSFCCAMICWISARARMAEAHSFSHNDVEMAAGQVPRHTSG